MSSHLTFLWPVSLGGQVLFEIGMEKKKTKYFVPGSRAVFTLFCLRQAVRAAGGAGGALLLDFCYSVLMRR